MTTKYAVIPVADLLPGERLHPLTEGDMHSRPGQEWAERASAGNYFRCRTVKEWKAEDEWYGDATHALVALPRAPARYVVKLAEEMIAGEPCLNMGSVEAMQKCFASEERMKQLTGKPPRWHWTGRPTDLVYKAAIVDLHDDWHRTHTSPPAPVKADPVGPTDEEVCEQYAIWQQVADKGSRNWHDGIPVNGTVVAWPDVRAAWSRVLAARIAASKELERRVVLGPVDDPGEA